MTFREETFGRYVLISRLGYGGMAEVFLARTEGLGGFAKRLAIKRLLPCYSEDQQTVDLLADEAKITVRLAHPNIVQVFDFGRVADSYYIAMEYVDGLDLKSVVEIDEFNSQPMPVDLALHVTHCVLEALDYAHNRSDEYGTPLNIIHRDVSPQNVLISRHGEVKLTDFGVARAAISCHVSVIGDIRGKFSYMPPEQATGGEIDQRIDIFAVGAILYELLTGKQPYRSVSSGQQIVQLFQDVTPPSQLRPELPPALDRLALKALARERHERFATAREFAAAVAAVLERRSDPVGLQRRLAQLVEQRLEGEDDGLDEMAPRVERAPEISALQTKLGFRGRGQALRNIVSGEIRDGLDEDAVAAGPIVPRRTEDEELDEVYLDEDSLEVQQTGAYALPQALGLAPTVLHGDFPPVPAALEDSSEAIPTMIASVEQHRAAMAQWEAKRAPRENAGVLRSRPVPREYLTPSRSEVSPHEPRRMPTEYLTPSRSDSAEEAEPRRMPTEYLTPSRAESAAEAQPRRTPTHYLTPPPDGDRPGSRLAGPLRARVAPKAHQLPSGRWAAMSEQLRESPLALYLTIAAVVLVLASGVLLAVWLAVSG